MNKYRTRKTCENCGSAVPSNRRDSFCSDLCTDDGYDIQRDYDAMMGYDRNGRQERWGSWDK